MLLGAEIVVVTFARKTILFLAMCYGVKDPFRVHAGGFRFPCLMSVRISARRKIGRPEEIQASTNRRHLFSRFGMYPCNKNFYDSMLESAVFIPSCLEWDSLSLKLNKTLRVLSLEGYCNQDFLKGRTGEGIL